MDGGISFCRHLEVTLFRLFLWCHLQDRGRGFQALGSVQQVAHAQ